LLIDQKPLALAYSGDELRNMLVQGDIALSLIWSGEAADIMEEFDNFKYVIPNEGSNTWVDCMAISKGSKNKYEAEQFINFMLRPDISMLNTEYVGYATPNYVTLSMLDHDAEKISK